MPPSPADRARRAPTRPAPPPAWTGPYDALVRSLSEAFPLLQYATPLNAAAEQRALLARWSAGDEVAPQWRAPMVDAKALARGHAAVERARASLPGATAWERVYAARLEELALDLELVAAAFGPGVVRRARARWGRIDAEVDRVALAWAAEARGADADADADDEASPRIPTDDEHDPRSLVASLRRAAGAARVPVRVLVRDRIGALAASGDGVVVVARGRATTPRETARVVLHEIEGHVLPRERAKSASTQFSGAPDAQGAVGAPAVIALGSAGASEDEEGRALVLEDRAGFLRGGRRRALGLRHLAARHVLAGAGYVELVRTLHREHGEPLEDALRLASRAMRGGHARGGDVLGGIAREIIYLPGYLRVLEATRDDAAALDRLGSARLSLAARATLGV
jgi:hypothetical protein